MLFLILLDTVNDAVVAEEEIVDEDMDADEGAENSGDDDDNGVEDGENSDPASFLLHLTGNIVDMYGLDIALKEGYSTDLLGKSQIRSRFINKLFAELLTLHSNSCGKRFRITA